MKTYLLNLAEMLSQCINTILLGHPNMTFSARCYVNRRQRGWRWMYHAINRVFFWQDDHCKESWMNDLIFARHAITLMVKDRE